MIKPVFRSRGLRIYTDKFSLQEKIYYEPDVRCQLHNKYITNLKSRGLLSLFEYSTVDDRIDTYNFHVNLTNPEFTQIYDGLVQNVVAEFNRVREHFGPSFQNYTVGYRLDGPQIVKQSFYFYPTVWKGLRYGIKGVTDRKKIVHDVTEFSNRITSGNKQTQKDISEFASMLYKFKGISIHVLDDVTGYKLYGRAENVVLRKYIMDRTGYDIFENVRHGDIVLVALRINNGLIKGYNIYFRS